MNGSVLQLPPQCIRRSSQNNSAQRACWSQHTQLMCRPATPARLPLTLQAASGCNHRSQFCQLNQGNMPARA